MLFCIYRREIPLMIYKIDNTYGGGIAVLKKHDGKSHIDVKSSVTTDAVFRFCWTKFLED